MPVRNWRVGVKQPVHYRYGRAVDGVLDCGAPGACVLTNLLLAVTNGNLAGAPVPVSNGLVTVAQDFYAAFRAGEDEQHIPTVDADGVALAAIQGLNQKLAEELKRRHAENAELKKELTELKRLLLKLSTNGD